MVTARGAAVWAITGKAVGENLEIVAPQAVQNLVLLLIITPHTWQMRISKKHLVFVQPNSNELLEGRLPA
jgi:hypothetical protein